MEERAALFRGRPVERLIFDTEDAAEIALVVEEFCRNELGSKILQSLFTRTSVGVVFGLKLGDGRRVVLKAHQPRQRVRFLQGVFETQSYLADRGFPCPRPLIPPARIGNGFATAEELVEEGFFADPHDASTREAIAQALARLIELTRRLRRPPALRASWSLWDAEGLWPRTAHSPIFDFGATAVGARWIDELASDAKARIPGGGEELIVHTDWSGKHFRFDDEGEITVVYDWDSLALRTETQALGTAAATFTSTLELDIYYAPTPHEVTAFIEDYSVARPTPLSTDEVLAAHAVAGYLMAYTARCEHALGVRGHFTRALGDFRRAYLAPAKRT